MLFPFEVKVVNSIQEARANPLLPYQVGYVAPVSGRFIDGAFVKCEMDAAELRSILVRTFADRQRLAGMQTGTYFSSWVIERHRNLNEAEIDEAYTLGYNAIRSIHGSSPCVWGQVLAHTHTHLDLRHAILGADILLSLDDALKQANRRGGSISWMKAVTYDELKNSLNMMVASRHISSWDLSWNPSQVFHNAGYDSAVLTWTAWHNSMFSFECKLPFTSQSLLCPESSSAVELTRALRVLYPSICKYDGEGRLMFNNYRVH